MAAGCIWCHAGEGARLSGVVRLLGRVAEARAEVRTVLTSSRGVAVPPGLPKDIVTASRPVDVRQLVDRFLSETRPEVAVFAGLDFPAAALPACREAGIGLVLLGAGRAPALGLRQWWNDFRVRNRLRQFDHILAKSDMEAQELRRAGADARRIEVLGPLEESGPPPPCNEAERDAMTDMLAARPAWLAASVQPDEAPAVAVAQRIATRASHRLLLIVVPAKESDGPAISAGFAAEGWQTGLRSNGDEPDANTQIYVADTEDELGLWLRLAPISFLGSSLLRGGSGCDPGAAASLGSAILHGPHMHRHAETVERLTAAGAARRVEDGPGLGSAVSALLSPDRAAAQANRAWEIATEGAEATERAVEIILSLMRADAA